MKSPFPCRYRRSLAVVTVPLFCIGCFCVGCSLPQKVGLTRGNQPRYESVEIDYRQQGNARSTATATGDEVETVSLANIEPMSAINPCWSVAHLAVEFPHPEGFPDLARATLRLSRTSRAPVTVNETVGQRIRNTLGRLVSGDSAATSPVTSTSAGESICPDDEIWILDLPKEQLDSLLSDLRTEGFFEKQSRPNGGTHLSVEINRGRTAKEWSSQPKLDELIARVYHDGMLDGFVAAAQTSGL